MSKFDRDINKGGLLFWSVAIGAWALAYAALFIVLGVFA